VCPFQFDVYFVMARVSVKNRTSFALTVPACRHRANVGLYQLLLILKGGITAKVEKLSSSHLRGLLRDFPQHDWKVIHQGAADELRLEALFDPSKLAEHTWVGPTGFEPVTKRL